MTPFAEKVYTLLRTVPKGRVTTYKALAHAAGTHAYRAVGQILKNNPDAPHIPCHRVVATNGTLGGFMGKISGEAMEKKIQLLRKEGVRIESHRIVDFETILCDVPHV